MGAVEYWQLDGGTWAAYTDNANLEPVAAKAGLKVMGVYFKGGRVTAKQFVGPRDVVMSVVKARVPFSPFTARVNEFGDELTPSRPKVKKACRACGATFAGTNRERYCPGCKVKAKKEATRRRVVNYRQKRGCM